ncbi:hypothetical protein PHB09_115 [Pseudomonas phage PHB09]|uniref:Uncharacterized protein n=1 Tax=Pseudomonas phage PHB09 TaxID=2867265 RepID=A0AAE8XCW3_9CAUD|nr:hypothetical protein QGX10_gp114 [Pseudomonas phage PHB09]UAV84610.1 hypothetical protein PHB09_115 [Pseudomonas phage PHB09]
MIECPICGADNFEYEDFCAECDSDLDVENWSEDYELPLEDLSDYN